MLGTQYDVCRSHIILCKAQYVAHSSGVQYHRRMRCQQHLRSVHGRKGIVRGRYGSGMDAVLRFFNQIDAAKVVEIGRARSALSAAGCRRRPSRTAL